MRKIIVCLMMALLLAGGVEAKTPRKTKRAKQRTTRTTTPKRKAPTPILEPQYQMDINYITNYSKEAYQNYLKGEASAEDLYNIGLQYYLGGGGYPKDRCEALRFYYLAAKAGHGKACFEVGQAYDDNPYVYPGCAEENYFEAAKWYARAKAHGNSNADYYLGALLKYGCITNEEFRIVTEQAGMDSQSARQEALGEQARVAGSVKNDKKYAHFYGTWTSARGTTFTITSGPYLDLRGAGKFSGEWRSNGELHVSFGYPDEINLRYSNGNLYDRDGRMYWKIGN